MLKSSKTYALPWTETLLVLCVSFALVIELSYFIIPLFSVLIHTPEYVQLCLF